MPPGRSRPPVRVRYYPRRVARPPVVEPLSPGRALHLADDPERAALARRTAEQEVFVGQPAEPVTVAAPPGGWWRRLWERLTGSH